MVEQAAVGAGISKGVEETARRDLRGGSSGSGESYLNGSNQKPI